MQATPLSPSHEPDPHADEKALRQARLQQLMLEAERVLAESREALAAHRRECQRLKLAVQEARARLARAEAAPAAQESARPVNMGSLSPPDSVQPRG